MKKSFCMLLALLLTVFFCLASAGAETLPKEEYKLCGFRVSWPETFGHTKGTLLFRDMGLGNMSNPILYLSQFDYIAEGQSIMLGRFFVTDIDAERLETVLIHDENMRFTPIAEYGGMNYIYLGLPADADVQVPDGYADEVKTLLAEIPKALASAEFFEPMDPTTAFIGEILSFESTDLDGNPVSSRELFQANRITLVNIWGTWCPNCVGEMAELVKLNSLMAQKGCGIVGIEFEMDPIDSIREYAKDFLNQYGVTYPNVMKVQDHEILDTVNLYPTSFFVDSEGRILSEMIAGAYIQNYISTFESLLSTYAADTPASGTAEATAAPVQANVFTVTVTDDGGNPIEGAMIKFCDEGPEGTCTIAQTDLSGKAVFSMEDGREYVVEVLMADGYEKPAEPGKATEPGELTLVLKKAESSGT